MLAKLGLRRKKKNKEGKKGRSSSASSAESSKKEGFSQNASAGSAGAVSSNGAISSDKDRLKQEQTRLEQKEEQQQQQQPNDGGQSRDAASGSVSSTGAGSGSAVATDGSSTSQFSNVKGNGIKSVVDPPVAPAPELGGKAHSGKNKEESKAQGPEVEAANTPNSDSNKSGAVGEIMDEKCASGKSSSSSESICSDQFSTLPIELDPKLHEKFGHLAAGQTKEAEGSEKWRDSTVVTDPETLYELGEELGEGSYGSVYKGRHRKTGVVCAIKIVPTDAEDTEELRKEIDFLKKASNPFVVGYHGSYQKGGSIWIVMDVCEAGSISDLIRSTQSTLREDEIQAVTACMLLGLKHLHGKRMIHRDIKAGNILLTSDGLAKLADFGVSKELNTVQSKCDTTIGTPYWMGPEVIQEGRYNAKADIWSLGITLIEMADGEPPFCNIHPMRALFVIPKKPPSTFHEPDLWSDDMNDFLAKCLIKSPDERLSAEQLLQHPFVAPVASELAKAVEPGADPKLRKSCEAVQIIEALVEECLPMIQARRLERHVAELAAAERGEDANALPGDPMDRVAVPKTLPKTGAGSNPMKDGTFLAVDSTVKLGTVKIGEYNRGTVEEMTMASTDTWKKGAGSEDFMSYFAGTTVVKDETGAIDSAATIKMTRQEFATLKLGKTRPHLQSGTMVEDDIDKTVKVAKDNEEEGDFMRYFGKGSTARSDLL